jgi:hypothetical protein
MSWTRAKAAASTVIASTMIAGIVVAGAAVVGAVACSSGPQPPTGMVRGMFEVYPGPAPANGPPTNSIPVSGQATFTDASGHAVTVAVPDTGKFTVRLPAGTYTAVLAPVTPGLVPARETIHVQANQTVQVTIDCSWDSGTC